MFFVNMTYVQYPRNHSEPTIQLGIKFLSCRHSQTAIRGKTGGFRFKSPHREQILLLLLILIFKSTYTLAAEMFGGSDFWLETRAIIKFSTHS